MLREKVSGIYHLNVMAGTLALLLSIFLEDPVLAVIGGINFMWFGIKLVQVEAINLINRKMHNVAVANHLLMREELRKYDIFRK